MFITYKYFVFFPFTLKYVIFQSAELPNPNRQSEPSSRNLGKNIGKAQRWAVLKISSANCNSTNLQIFQFFYRLQTFRKCGNLRICDLQTIFFLRFANLRFGNPIICCGLKIFANQQYKIFPLQIYVNLKCSHSKVFGRVLSYLAFHSQKYT